MPYIQIKLTSSKMQLNVESASIKFFNMLKQKNNSKLEETYQSSELKFNVHYKFMTELLLILNFIIFSLNKLVFL